MENFEAMRRAHNATKCGYCNIRFKAEPQAIECDTLTNCKSCGWNPEVERWRIKRIRNEMHIRDPEEEHLIRVK